MRKLIIVCVGAACAYALAAVTNYSVLAQGDSAPNSYVRLQTTTPGTAQTGHSNITGTMLAGQFPGGGAGLTALNASNLGIGTLADARLSANVPFKGATNAFGNFNN